MGRRSHSQTLALWANGERVGRWTVPARGPMELQYDRSWLDSPAGRPLSLSLPCAFGETPNRGPVVENYFEGLLPDSEVIRRRVAARFGTGSLDAFDLLAAIGRDCVGALQLLPEDQAPRGVDRVDGVPIDEEGIERHLLEVVAPGHFAARDPDDDFRLSLAGAQEKDAFLRWNGRWMKPRGATPTTHIFKLPMGLVGNRQADFRTSVDNEWLCLRLLAAYGLPVAQAEIMRFGQQRVLVVERFDRRTARSGDRLLRLMQEDFCQATGTSPLRKYESHGGPGLVDIAGLLRQSTAAPQDLRTLLASQILFWMLRAPDGHAKNFSIQLQAGLGGVFAMTPLYDVMSALPVIGSGAGQWSIHQLKMAMALVGKNRHYAVMRIQRRHFNSTARRIGFGRDAEPLLREIIERTPAVVETVAAALPAGFSQVVADRILNGLLAAARELAAMPAELQSD